MQNFISAVKSQIAAKNGCRSASEEAAENIGARGFSSPDGIYNAELESVVIERNKGIYAVFSKTYLDHTKSHGEMPSDVKLDACAELKDHLHRLVKETQFDFNGEDVGISQKALNHADSLLADYKKLLAVA